MDLQNLTEQQQYNYCEDTKKLKNKIESDYIEIAKRLHTIKINKLYEAQYGSWSLYLDDAKIGQAKAEQLIRIYEKFILEHKVKQSLLIDAGGWSVVIRLLPMAKTKEMAENALLQASLLPNRVSTANYVKDAMKQDFAECECLDTYTIKICRACGDREKVYEDKN